MKVFEVGLICEFEGGHGVLIADSDSLYTDAKLYLLGSVSRKLRDMESLYDNELDEYEINLLAKLRKESQKAHEDIGKAKNIDDLRKIRMEESSLMVIVKEREVLGGGK